VNSIQHRNSMSLLCAGISVVMCKTHFSLVFDRCGTALTSVVKRQNYCAVSASCRSGLRILKPDDTEIFAVYDIAVVDLRMNNPVSSVHYKVVVSMLPLLNGDFGHLQVFRVGAATIP
jgi:hypothetical protein